MLRIGNKTISIIEILLIMIIPVIAISVGFSALSSSVAINGFASIRPIGFIIITDISPDLSTNVNNISSSHTHDTITVSANLPTLSDTVVYNVEVRNMGQTRKSLIEINPLLLSNSDIEYTISGVVYGEAIEPEDTVNITVTFKYKDGVDQITSDSLNAQLQFIFDDYVDQSAFPIVFSHEGACTFNGSTAKITGDECSDYWNDYYIDTGIDLYSQDNWDKDYEIGFTIVSYNNSQQSSGQAVFVNSKHEIGEGIMGPGLAFRKKGGSNTEVEITEYINTNATQSINAANIRTVKIIRRNKIVYYSINNGQIIQLQDMSNFNKFFDNTVWFGAAADSSGNPMRHLKATLSNMYIKFGGYIAKRDTVTFNPNGGTLSEITRRVDEGSPIGVLPVPTRDGFTFDGWYLEPNFTTLIDATYIVSSNINVYAKWSTYTAKIGNNYYTSLDAAIKSIGDSTVLTSITLLDDTVENLTIPETANIELDLNNHSITNKTTASVFENSGTLKISNGTLISNSTGNSVVNNYGTAELDDLTITMTGAKQCVYNKAGTITIKGASHFTDTSSNRATVHNLNNGTMYILGGTIESVNYIGLLNENGTLVIGEEGGGIDDTDPEIKGKTYGISSTPNYSFFDGIAKGKTNGVNNQSKITVFEDNSQKTTGTDGDYKTFYLTATRGAVLGARRTYLRTVFEETGSCNFDGQGGNITGCSTYSNKSYIDTGVKLFDEDNWSKDFVISFELSNYNPGEQNSNEIQQTIINSMPDTKESNNPGFVFRRNGTNLALKVNSGSGPAIEKKIASNVLNKVKIVRKDKKLYYSFNDDELSQVYDLTNFTEMFDLPVMFGAALDASNKPMRYVKATISNMSIKTGTIVNLSDV